MSEGGWVERKVQLALTRKFYSSDFVNEKLWVLVRKNEEKLVLLQKWCIVEDKSRCLCLSRAQANFVRTKAFTNLKKTQKVSKNTVTATRSSSPLRVCSNLTPPPFVASQVACFKIELTPDTQHKNLNPNVGLHNSKVSDSIR